jgi:hypothetical protein
VSTPRSSGSTLLALSLLGNPFSPAGAGLNLTGSGYPSDCKTAYFFFDGTRIGSAPVNSNHEAHVGSVSAPGDAGVGEHTVTTSCHASGKDVVSLTRYRVTSSHVHRTAFLTSLNQPRNVSLTLKSILLSALIAALLFLLLAFPSQIFNSTLQENYEEVRGWFHLGRPLSEVVNEVDQVILFPIFLVVGGAMYALLTPDFGWNMSTLALSLGLAIAVAVTTIGFAFPAFFYFGERLRDRGQILVLPGTLAVAAVMVGLSRLLHFQPGYLYGVLAVFVFHHDIDRDTSGRLAAISAVLVMAAAFTAWTARVPLAGSTMTHAGFWSLVLESAIGGAFVIGLESTLVGLLPMRFLDGSRVMAWNRVVWAILAFLALFTFVQVLVQPGTGYVGHASTAGKITVLSLYLAFALGSIAFWAYFRYRQPLGPTVPGEDELEMEGEYGVR